MTDSTQDIKSYPVNLSYHERLEEINRLLAELDKHRWRKVEDELPEKHEKVQAFTKDGILYNRAWLALCCGKLAWEYSCPPDSFCPQWLNKKVIKWKPITPPEDKP